MSGRTAENASGLIARHSTSTQGRRCWRGTRPGLLPDIARLEGVGRGWSMGRGKDRVGEIAVIETKWLTEFNVRLRTGWS